MPTYIALIDWTDQGVRNFKDTVDRYEAAQSAFEGLGVRLRPVDAGCPRHRCDGRGSRRRSTCGGAAGRRPAGQHPDDDAPGIHRRGDEGHHRQGGLTPQAGRRRGERRGLHRATAGASDRRSVCVPSRAPDEGHEWLALWLSGRLRFVLGDQDLVLEPARPPGSAFGTALYARRRRAVSAIFRSHGERAGCPNQDSPRARQRILNTHRPAQTEQQSCGSPPSVGAVMEPSRSQAPTARRRP